MVLLCYYLFKGNWNQVISKMIIYIEHKKVFLIKYVVYFANKTFLQVPGFFARVCSSLTSKILCRRRGVLKVNYAI